MCVGKSKPWTSDFKIFSPNKLALNTDMSQNWAISVFMKNAIYFVEKRDDFLLVKLAKKWHFDSTHCYLMQK
jgi:hypothetical protein